MRTRVYVAGPISQGGLQENIDRAREATRQLMAAGFAPWCPQLSCFLAGNEPSAGAGFSHAEWLEVDLPWVAAADAVLRLPGESRGADQEVVLARELGIPVYLSVDELVKLPPQPRR